MAVLKPFLALTCIVFMCAVVFYVAKESFWNETGTDRASSPSGGAMPSVSGNYERTEPIHGEIDVERYSTESESTTPPEEGYGEGFAYDYYKAVEGESWATIYSMLDSQSQSLISPEEWAVAQEQRAVDEGKITEVVGAELDLLDGDDETGYSAEVILYHGDRSETTIPIEITVETTGEIAGYRRSLSDGDLQYLQSLIDKSQAQTLENPGYDYDCPRGRPDSLSPGQEEIESEGGGYFCKGYTEDWGDFFVQNPID